MMKFTIVPASTKTTAPANAAVVAPQTVSVPLRFSPRGGVNITQEKILERRKRKKMSKSVDWTVSWSKLRSRWCERRGSMGMRPRHWKRPRKTRLIEPRSWPNLYWIRCLMITFTLFWPCHFTLRHRSFQNFLSIQYLSNSVLPSMEKNLRRMIIILSYTMIWKIH